MGKFVRNVALLTGGIAAGFALAHFVNKTERGQAVLADVNSFVENFTDAVKEGYEARTDAIYSAIETGSRSPRA